jgi:cell division protein FtsB
MKVQFDLRPTDLLQKEDRKASFNLTRLIVVLLFLVFLGVTGFYIVTTTFAVWSLGDSVEYKRSEVRRLEAGKAALDAEIKRLQEREKLFADTLKIMQDDLPVLEVFEAIENCVEYGMRISDLKFAPGAPPLVVLNAAAGTDEQTTRFRIGLENSGVFSKVTMPASRLDEKSRTVLFTLNLTPLPIGQIKPYAAPQEGVKNNERQ